MGLAPTQVLQVVEQVLKGPEPQLDSALAQLAPDSQLFAFLSELARQLATDPAPGDVIRRVRAVPHMHCVVPCKHASCHASMRHAVHDGNVPPIASGRGHGACIGVHEGCTCPRHLPAHLLLPCSVAWKEWHQAYPEVVAGVVEGGSHVPQRHELQQALVALCPLSKLARRAPTSVPCMLGYHTHAAHSHIAPAPHTVQLLRVPCLTCPTLRGPATHTHTRTHTGCPSPAHRLASWGSARPASCSTGPRPTRSTGEPPPCRARWPPRQLACACACASAWCCIRPCSSCARLGCEQLRWALACGPCCSSVRACMHDSTQACAHANA